LLIFAFLALISTTNSISLAIRTDWSYEKITDLFSYDIVIWPWMPFKQEGIILDLTKPSEQARWNLNWGEGCNPPLTEPRFSVFGLELGPCKCTFNNTASRTILIPKEFKYLKIEACSRFAGGDGAVLDIFIDNVSYSYFINTPECKNIPIDIPNFSDNNPHTLTLQVKRNGVCDHEVIEVKKITFLKNITTSEEENLVKNPLIWKIHSVCNIYWLNDSIVTDKCYCTDPSYAYTIIKFRKELSFLNLEICGDEAGNDGVLAKVIINGNTYNFLVPSTKCILKSIPLNFQGEKINLTLTSDVYGYCDKERVIWKKIKFENYPNGSKEEQREIYDLRSKEEQTNWKLNFPEVCRPPLTEPRFSELGIETGPCACSFINNASRKIKLPKELNALRIEVCSRFAGGDGNSVYVYIDNEIVKRANVNSDTCKTLIINISKFADDKEHVLTLESRRHNTCGEEVAIWKEIELIKWNYTFPTYQFDFLDEMEKWKSVNIACPAVFTLQGIITDVCGCSQQAKVAYSFETKEDKEIRLKIIACADLAGGDGTIGEIIIDENIKQIFVNSNNCSFFEEKIKLKEGNHTLYLQPQSYGNCSAEWIKWNKVVIEE
jgi:hypothetical protein